MFCRKQLFQEICKYKHLENLSKYTFSGFLHHSENKYIHLSKINQKTIHHINQINQINYRNYNNFKKWNSNFDILSCSIVKNKNNLLCTNLFKGMKYSSTSSSHSGESQNQDKYENFNAQNIMNTPAFHNAVYSRLRQQLFLRHRGPSVPTMQSGSLVKDVRLTAPSLLELPQEVLKFNSIPRHTTYIMQSYAAKKLAPIVAQPVQMRKSSEGHISSETAVIRAGTGNILVTIVKAISYMMTGSAAMFAECVHSLVDSINQGLLYKGVRQARQMPDKKHQYGYGRAMYVWSMISATIMLWTGGFATIYHGVHQIVTPDTQLLLGWLTPAVLLISGAIDSYVFIPVLRDTMNSKPKGMSWYKHFFNMKDPMIAAVLFEDMAACLGVVIAFFGLSASYVTGNPLYDGLASISIGVLLGSTSLAMIAMNKRFLLGQAVDSEIEQGIKELLEQRISISRVSAVQSQWLSANRFIFKAELDFEGEYFANYLGQLCYNQMFKEVTKEKELTVLLNCYTEDVIRMMEEEIDSIEDEIRTKYPEAAYIELEPSSVYPTSLKALHFTKTIS